MLKVIQKNDDYEVIQVCKPPTVYLDQWAWVLISKDDEFKKQLLKALKIANASVLISNISFMELAKINDKVQIENLSKFFDFIDMGFIESNPRKVIDMEDELKTNQWGQFEQGSPAFDGAFVEILVRQNNYTNPLNISKLLHDLKSEDKSRYEIIIKDTVKNFSSILDELRSNDSNLKERKKHLTSGKTKRPSSPYTQDIFDYLISYL
ncbi:MAG: hypothetical protein HY356_08390, partial [Gammaproteobacteria bacterium]|nr:hypothetical protein [Gammaproteobacteria bacterium]